MVLGLFNFVADYYNISTPGPDNGTAGEVTHGSE